MSIATMPEPNAQLGTLHSFVSYDTKQDDITINPTQRTYGSLTEAYAFFNAELFDGKLPPCLITMQRKKGARGYFSGERFESQDDNTITDEIALNPVHFKARPTINIISTLVHEMVHLWQHNFATPSRNGYHNRQWATKMREVGLIPTSTGEPGGKETGQSVTHMIQEGGPYALAYAKFELTGAALLYHDRQDERSQQKKAASKTKYTCPLCNVNAWAKPNTALICGDCHEPMVGDTVAVPPTAPPMTTTASTPSPEPPAATEPRKPQPKKQPPKPNQLSGRYSGGAATIIGHDAVMGRWETNVRQWAVGDVSLSTKNVASTSIRFIKPGKRNSGSYTVNVDTRYLTVEAGCDVLYDSRWDVPVDMDRWAETNAKFTNNRPFTTVRYLLTKDADGNIVRTEGELQQESS